MSSEALADTRLPRVVAGWYGKLPALGDFASRRVPPEFLEVWDTWLQRSIAASRRQLGERWLDVYLTSPIWRFVLFAGACGPSAWAGVLMPSVDKVGRYFPLTIALRLGAESSGLGVLTAASEWYAAIETIALATLDEEFTVEALEERLAELHGPSGGRLAADADELARWWSEPTQPLSLVTPRDLCTLVSEASLGVMATNAPGRTLWQARAPGDSSYCTLGYTGLPPESEFATLMSALA